MITLDDLRSIKPTTNHEDIAMTTIQLNTTCTAGKSLAIKRNKANDEEVTRAHLKVSDLFLTREQINSLCGMRPGWAETSFFDEYGAPFGEWALALRTSEFAIGGLLIGGHAPGGMHIANATLSGVEITMTKLGAVLAGHIVWQAAGDEVSDAEPLLGRQCQIVMALDDGGQRDMFSPNEGQEP